MVGTSTRKFKQEQSLDWADAGFAVPHSMIRDQLKKFTQATNPENLLNPILSICDESKQRCVMNESKKRQIVKKRVDALTNWFETYFMLAVHHHHRTEEEIFFPWLQEQLDALKPPKKIPEHSSDEHEPLLDDIDNMKEELQKLKDMFSGAEYSLEYRCEFDEVDYVSFQQVKLHVMALHKKQKQLEQEMNEHLEGEEKDIAPLLREHSTEKKLDAIVTTINKKLGLEGARICLPWIWDLIHTWATEEQAKHFYSQLPLPFRGMMWLKWNSDYKKENKELMNSLIEGTYALYE